MSKLTKKAIRDGRTYPNYRKASLLKIVSLQIVFIKNLQNHKNLKNHRRVIKIYLIFVDF